MAHILVSLLLLLGIVASSAAHADDWSLHGQATAIPQFHSNFQSPYAGPNSLQAQPENKTSITSTLFLGRKLWLGGELYFNPELSAGSGLSSTHGMAGFPNGEIYRVDTPDPKVSLARLFFRQEIGLGGEKEKIEEDKNEVGGLKDISRISIIIGRFSLNDYFDNNTYSHDPRTQFMNWSLMDNGAWDYAADTRGYTWSAYLEWKLAFFSFRFAEAMEVKEANQLVFDHNLYYAHGDNLEVEYRYSIITHPGAARLLSYDNHAHMGNYAIALQQSATNPDITSTRAYNTKYGFGLNIEQEITADLGIFSRLGWNNGKTETWNFTEVDQTVSVGSSLKGSNWSRSNDTVGIAAIINGISSDHHNYLQAGGSGFMLGDGTLRYKQEKIIELYYSFAILKCFSISPDYQHVANPGYNADRGPISIWAVRTHAEF